MTLREAELLEGRLQRGCTGATKASADHLQCHRVSVSALGRVFKTSTGAFLDVEPSRGLQSTHSDIIVPVVPAWGAPKSASKQCNILAFVRKRPNCTHKGTRKIMHDPTANEIGGNLERRIEVIEMLGNAELGSFTKWDWLLCITGAVVVPAIILWWFAG